MKRNLIVSLISILLMTSVCFGASYIIHDYDTGIMHMAQDIYLTNTRSVQTEIDSIEVNLGTTYAISLKADKAGDLSQFTGGTNLNQIATRNHSDLQNINSNESYQHLTTAEIANITLKSGSLTQLTTRNHNDLQNLNATSAHPSASIDNTATSYGRGLATTDNTVQKVADRVNQNGTPQFVTDKSKCSLLLDFDGTLADKTAGINPIGSDAVNKWVDGYVNDSTSKANATNISCTFKSFEGDEGKFGSGVAVEESRTNLLTYSDDLTNAAWGKNNCTVTLDRILPDGRKLFKVTAIAGGGVYIAQNITFSATTYSATIFTIDTPIDYFFFDDSYTNIIAVGGSRTQLTKLTGTYTTSTANTRSVNIGVHSMLAGQSFYLTSPQLEVGAFPTSYIATGATAVTRPANIYKFDGKIVGKVGTISAWVKYPALGLANQQMTPFQIYNATAVFDVYGGASPYATRIGGGATAYLTYTFLTNTWYLWTVKWDGTTISWYINGILIKETAQGTDFGLFTTMQSPAAGSMIISNFEIFNYALTADEIANIYNAGLEGKPIVTTNPLTIIPVGQSLYDPLYVTFTSGWGISSTYPNKPTLSNHDNIALLRGIIEYSGVINSDVTLFTLPVGARPSLPDTYFNSFIVSSRDSGAPSVRILRVYGNGEVKLMAAGATITNPAISLDGINFINGK